jgi:signal transduction histidine kinase/CheY-like chemotaxis protein
VDPLEVLGYPFAVVELSTFKVRHFNRPFLTELLSEVSDSSDLDSLYFSRIFTNIDLDRICNRYLVRSNEYTFSYSAPGASGWKVIVTQKIWEEHEALCFLFIPAATNQSKDSNDDPNSELSRLQQVARALPIWHFERDADANLISWDLEMETFLGYSSGEVLDNRINRLPFIDEDFSLKIDSQRQYKGIDSRGGFYEEVELTKKNGEVVVCDWVEIPEYDSTNKLVCFHTYLIDKTREYQAELNEVEHRKQRFQLQKMESLNQMIHNINHDFSNLVTVIRGCLEYTLRSVKGDEIFVPRLKEIRRACDSANSLTRLVNGFSEHRSTEPILVNLSESVSSMQMFLQQMAGEHLELDLQLDETLPYIFIDPFRVEQIIVSIVLALKESTKEGGKITISTFPRSAEKKSVTGETPKLIGLNFLGDAPATHRRDKTKIITPTLPTEQEQYCIEAGIAVTANLVKELGGDIELVCDELGRVSISVLFEESEQQHPGLSPTVPEGSIGPMNFDPVTVLLVEDDAMLMEMLQLTLTQKEYEVLTATSAEDAIDLIDTRGDDIDILITDVILPNKNGCDIAEYSLMTFPHIRIDFMSGYPDVVLLNAGLNPESYEFIAKPFTPHQLTNRIKMLVSKNEQKTS